MGDTALVQREPSAGGLAYVVTDAGLAVVERLAAAGNADATIALALGLNRKVFSHLLREGDDGDERVIDAYYIGKGALADELTDILFTHAREGNVTALIYLSKARLGWRDQGPAAPVGNAVQINITVPAPMSNEEFAKMIEVKQQ